MFTLHERLKADCLDMGSLSLCRVLLMNDARFPWVILVPERAGVREILDLSADDRALLWGEVERVADVLSTLFRPDKINIGAIGNLVPQLHVHVVARFAGDAVWPKPVWGQGTAEPYAPAALADRLARLREGLAA